MRDPLSLVIVGQVIKMARHDAGLKAIQLATKACISRPFLTQIENGNRACSFKALDAIAAALDMDLSTLILRAEAIQPLQRSTK
jgi:transcriptional regulator with XRE-family HTH domain